MKNKLDNRDDYDVGDSNSLNGLNDKDIAKKFDEQMIVLKEIATKELKEREVDGDTVEGIEDKINAFFDEGNKEFNMISSIKEIKTKIKYRRIAKRDIKVQDAIKASGESVLDEVLKWKEKKNHVAKSLLGIANWILKSEK